MVESRYDTLNSTECFMIFKKILTGINTTMDISKVLKKERGTISEQLNSMYRDGILLKDTSKKERKFIVNTPKLMKIITKTWVDNYKHLKGTNAELHKKATIKLEKELQKLEKDDEFIDFIMWVFYFSLENITIKDFIIKLQEVYLPNYMKTVSAPHIKKSSLYDKLYLISFAFDSFKFELNPVSPAFFKLLHKTHKIK